MEKIMKKDMVKKVLIFKTVDSKTYGDYRFYSKDVSVCNMAISIGISPEIKMDNPDVLPEDNLGYYLSWSGGCKHGESIIMDNIKLYFDKVFCIEELDWDFSYLEDEDTYIQYIIDHKDELGISEFFD